MSPTVKTKEKEFKLSPKVIFRLIIFFALIYFLINYLSKGAPITQTTSNPDPTVLGEEITLDHFYSSLPENTKVFLDNSSNHPVIIEIQEKLNDLKSLTKDFPQKQIKEFKKTLVKNISEEILRSIDEE